LADLEKADLEGANLDGAILLKANLKGANLIGSRNLVKSQLDQACVDETTKLPPEFTNIRFNNFCDEEAKTMSGGPSGLPDATHEVGEVPN